MTFLKRLTLDNEVKNLCIPGLMIKNANIQKQMQISIIPPRKQFAFAFLFEAREREKPRLISLSENSLMRHLHFHLAWMRERQRHLFKLPITKPG
ncbi:hypothetical protein CEXT_331 [Caerostris extrusa]|uniref:Uncharacterized protein n=1 Tax=Caerostris extrusa TaxID=172846 RepID=A0AAV4X212_CAEEX|nr:hypothetical protein CEXT_331 [Caerostris extrusa]